MCSMMRCRTKGILNLFWEAGRTFFFHNQLQEHMDLIERTVCLTGKMSHTLHERKYGVTLMKAASFPLG